MQQINERLKFIKKTVICTMVWKSDLEVPNIYQRKTILDNSVKLEYKDIIQAKSRIEPWKKGKFIYNKPSERYKRFKEQQENCLFNIKKRQILGSKEFLDSLLPKLWNIQQTA